MKLPNCGVYAVAVIANPELPIAEWMKKFRKWFDFGANWRGVTNVIQLEVALKKNGIKTKRVEVEKKVGLARWVDYYAKPNTRYIVRTGYHFQAVADGICIDQNEVNKVENFWGRKKRVTHVIEIVE